MNFRKGCKGFIYTLLFIVLIAFDQFTKYLATTTLKGSDPFVVIKDVFEFHYLNGGNTGAAWGILSGKINFFIILTTIVCFILFIVVIRIEKIIQTDYSVVKKMTLLQCTIIVLLSGAVGNLMDRIMNGYVIDFIYFKLIDFPIFNVADCYVTLSAILLIIICLFFMSDEEFSKVFSLRPQKKITDK